ncbi:MAG: hypothetical protein VKJ02_12750 [Snowella sp.]|nr:hypothetical protein [Snowella sp.]
MLIQQLNHQQSSTDLNRSIGTNKRFTATNRNNPCPICEKTNGNCRILEDDGILCMTYADGYGASNHPDYRFTKPTKNGLWGIYYPRRNNDFHREEWLKEQEFRKAQEKKKQEQRSKAALSIEERDKDIQVILEQLSLNDSDRQRLRDRGLTDEQINEIGYRSVTKWQKLNGPLRYGVNQRGNLNNPYDGILCPIRNHKGQFVALRLHNPNRRPKYRAFKGSHLESGEFPIAVYGADLAQGIIGITEGLEIKPAIASYRLGIPVIGHNGSNFTSSPLQVRETLEALKIKVIRIYVDAGVINNPNLVRQYKKAIALYREWGYTVEIVWWGQVNKTDGDIDEIDQTTLNSIRYITPEAFLSYCHDPQVKRFGDWVKNQLQRIKPKGFGVPKIEGQEFEGERAKALMGTLGDVLDCSQTGDGKSHSVPKIENEDGKIWYCYNDHRNPTVKAIEDEFKDLFPRNQYGFYRENGKLKKATEETPKNQIEMTNGHCPRAELFPKLSDLGYNPNEGGSQNPICQSCPYLTVCQSVEGWYLKDRRDTLSNAHKIRCHVESMPREWDYSNDLGIYDEASRLFQPTKTIETTWDKLYLELGRGRKGFNNKQALIVDATLQALKSCFETHKRYGLDHEEILKALAELELQKEDLDAIIDALTTIPLNLSEIFEKADELDLSSLSQAERKKYKGLIKTTKAHQNRKAYQASQVNLDKLLPNGLLNVMKALRGDKGIDLSIAYGNLTITLDNRDSYSFINQTKKNIYLDATLSVEELKMRTGSDRPITAIRSKTKPTTNLTVVQIKTQGIGSNQVSKQAINRLRKICQALGDMPVIASKLIREYLDTDGHWFNHNRASNDFVGKQKLLIIGLPRPNLGAIKSQYRVLNGTLDGFEEYYQKLINQEIIQAVGRQRANRFPDKQFTLYFVTPEDTDLSWLSEYGIKITVKSAFEIDPNAGTETQCTRLQIVNAAQSLLVNGAKVTQTAIAKVLGMTQQAISKTLTDSGVNVSWIVEKLNKTLPNGYTTGAYKDSIRPSCITQELYKLFADFFQLDPLELLRDALDTIKERGFEHFATEYLENFPKALQAKYLTLLWTVLQSESMPTENRSSNNVKSHSSLREIFLL